MDSHGRIYYIDHNTKTTTWHKPQTDGRLISLKLFVMDFLPAKIHFFTRYIENFCDLRCETPALTSPWLLEIFILTSALSLFRYPTQCPL